MTQQLPGSGEEDRAMIHHFIRLVGRAPSDAELIRFRELHAQLALSRTPRQRRRATRLLVRL